jgi:hypothetical protein
MPALPRSGRSGLYDEPSSVRNTYAGRVAPLPPYPFPALPLALPLVALPLVVLPLVALPWVGLMLGVSDCPPFACVSCAPAPMFGSPWRWRRASVQVRVRTRDEHEREATHVDGRAAVVVARDGGRRAGLGLLAGGSKVGDEALGRVREVVVHCASPV